MAQAGYTPLLIYGSGTTGNTPLAANLTSSAAGAELALNYFDGKLFYKDNAGVVQVLAVKMPSGILPIANGGTAGTATPTAGAVAYGTGTAYAFTSAGTSGQVLTSNGAGAPTWANLSGVAVTTLSFGTTGLTPAVATSGAITVAGTLITSNGGTGLSSYTAGDLPYYAAGTALTKLPIGTNGQILTSSGTAPQWTSGSSISVGNLAGGVAGSLPYQTGAGATTFLGIGAANSVLTSTGTAPQWNTSLTGLTGVSSSSITNTSLTSGRVIYSTTGGAETDSANLTFDGTTLATTRASVTAAAGSTALTLTGGTQTTSWPVINATQTWNAGGVTFTGMRFNATDTASASGSLLMDLQVGGTSRIRFYKTNTIEFGGDSGGYWFLGSQNAYFAGGGGWHGAIDWALNTGSNRASSAVYMTLNALTNELTLQTQLAINNNVKLNGEAANTLAQRNATNAQTFRIYNTYTSGTNYELGKLEWASNVLRIGTEKGSGGGTARALELQTDGTTRVTISTTGVATFGRNVSNTGELIVLNGDGSNNGAIALRGSISSNGFYGLFYDSPTDSTALVGYSGRTITFGFAGLSPSSYTANWVLTANTFEQRNATNAQTFRIYNTYTSGTNYQRLGITSASTTLSAMSGASVTATNLIPAGAVVVGVTTRVSTLITGATGYQVGVAATPTRWGDITGTAVGTTSDNTNWTTGTIECFTAATDVVITAKTSNFTAGAIVVTVHYLIGQAD